MAQLNVGFILARRFTLCALANFVDVLRLAADEGDRSRPILCAWKVLSPTMEPIASSCGIVVQPEERLGDAVGSGNAEVRNCGDGVGAGEHRSTGADAVGVGEQVEHNIPLGVPLGVLLVGGSAEPVEVLAGQPACGGPLSPTGDQVVGPGVVLRRAGLQHDVLDLGGVSASSDLGFELL